MCLDKEEFWLIANKDQVDTNYNCVKKYYFPLLDKKDTFTFWDDVVFKTATVLRNNGEAEEAEQLFMSLVTECPLSPHVEKAKQILKMD